MQTKQIKENNFPTAQYPGLGQISQTDQLQFSHKRSSQIFKVVQHPMPRRVTMLAFQNVSTVFLLILWFSSHLPVCSACGQIVTPVGARDNSKRRWGFSLNRGRDIYSTSVEASFLPCLHSSNKFITATAKQQLLYFYGFSLWPMTAFGTVMHAPNAASKNPELTELLKTSELRLEMEEKRKLFLALELIRCAFPQLPLHSPSIMILPAPSRSCY